MGSIDVITSTINAGTAPPVNYRVTIDGARLTTVPVDGTTRLSDVTSGARNVRIEGIPAACRVAADVATAQVTAGATTSLAFIVICPGAVQNGDRILLTVFTTYWNHLTNAPDGSDLRMVLGSTPDVEQEGTWSQDGTRIAFTSNREGNTVHVFVMNADGSSVRRVSDSPFEKSGVSWAPDGRSVVFGGVLPGTLGFDLFRASVDSAHVERIALTLQSEDEYPSWSPDGSEIAYAAGSSRLAEDIYSMKPDGTGIQLLFDAGGTARYPRWSPDGRKLVFEANRSTGQPRDIILINSDGSGAINLTNGLGDNREPSWSPDGTKILFGSDRLKTQDLDFDICVMDADGQNVRRLTSLPSRERSPDWRRR